MHIPEKKMSKFTLPELSQEQKDLFQEAFATDLEYLKSIEKNSQSSYGLFLQICSTPSLSILTEEEVQGLFQLGNRSEQQAATLKSVKEKGPKATLLFYLCLYMNNSELYGHLPSSQSTDKKLDQLSKLRDEFLVLLKTSFNETLLKSGFSGVSKPTASVAAVRPNIHIKDERQDKTNDEKESESDGLKKDTQDSQQVTERNRGKEKMKKETESLSVDVDRPRPKYQRRWGIKKDDEFFHFIVICFSIGATLICSYSYADWTISAGIGLICFATIETIAIYFGLIEQIRRILDYLQTVKLPAGLPSWPKRK
ncbi:transmembrane protein 40 isoform X1 [Pelobates fuscus]|uniref:transmembrane protein 40 isoform X1 n=2 Tax=Pelobates fuscus TaxID=191477 RepID=UPI002FE45764